MGCAKRIRSDLTSFSPGGKWKYIGYTPIKNNPFDETPVIPLLDNLSNNTDLSSLGDDFVIDTEGKTSGYYAFEYTLGSNISDFVLRVIEDTVTSGRYTPVYRYVGDDPIDLQELLQNENSGGTWTSLTEGVELDGTVLDLNISAGKYGFIYSLKDGFINKGCENCPNLDTLVDVYVFNPDLIANIDVSDTTVVYEIIPYSVSTDTLKIPDYKTFQDYYVRATAKFKLFEDNTELSYLYRIKDVVGAMKMSIGIVNNYLYPIPSGGYVKEVFMQHNTTLDVITVPTAPDTATLTGVGGTVTANDLYLNGVTYNNFVNSLAIVIKNYLNDSNTRFESSISGNINSYYISLRTVIPFSNDVVRYGVDSFRISNADGSVQTLIQGNINGSIDRVRSYTIYTLNINVTNNYGQLTNCPGAMSYKVTNTWADYILSGDSTFNNLIINTSVPMVSSGLDNNRVECAAKLLSVTTEGCPGTLTYQWRDSLGAVISESNSVKVIEPGEYTVKITCSTGTSLTLSKTI